MSPDPSPATYAIVDNPAAQQFEAYVDGQLAVAQYERRRDQIIFTHTEVPASLEGRGIANALAQYALDHTRAEGLRVVPACPFFRSFIHRHPEYSDLVSR